MQRGELLHGPHENFLNQIFRVAERNMRKKYAVNCARIALVQRAESRAVAILRGMH
jgi:hypothetical protein